MSFDVAVVIVVSCRPKKGRELSLPPPTYTYHDCYLDNPYDKPLAGWSACSVAVGALAVDRPPLLLLFLHHSATSSNPSPELVSLKWLAEREDTVGLSGTSFIHPPVRSLKIHTWSYIRMRLSVHIHRSTHCGRCPSTSRVSSIGWLRARFCLYV